MEPQAISNSEPLPIDAVTELRSQIDDLLIDMRESIEEVGEHQYTHILKTFMSGAREIIIEKSKTDEDPDFLRSVGIREFIKDPSGQKAVLRTVYYLWTNLDITKEYHIADNRGPWELSEPFKKFLRILNGSDEELNPAEEEEMLRIGGGGELREFARDAETVSGEELTQVKKLLANLS